MFHSSSSVTGSDCNVSYSIVLNVRAPAVPKSQRSLCKVAFSDKLFPRQAIDSLDAMYAAGDEAKTTFDPFVQSLALKTRSEPVLAPLKGRTRAEEKIAADFHGDVSMLTDLVSTKLAAEPCFR